MRFCSKLFLVLLSALVSATSCYAWVPNPEIVERERSVEISVQGEDAVVRIRSRLENVSSVVQRGKSWLPVVEVASDVKAFLDVEGVGVHDFEGRARLDALADAAESWRDVRFFRMAANPWARVYRTYEFEVAPGEVRELVWEYRQSVEVQGEFEGIEVFLDDGVRNDLFQVEFSLGTSKPLRHFWSPVLADSVIDRSEYGIVAIEQHRDFLPTSDLLIIWSGVENPVAKFYAGGHEYVGHFVPLSPAKNFNNVTLLLDSSGSMSDVWLHVQELVRFLLEHQENKKFRVMLAGDGSSEWLIGNASEFVVNDSRMRQKVLEAMAWRTPLGKANLSDSLDAVREPLEDHLVVVFSDAEEVLAVGDSAPVAVLQFYPEDRSSTWRRVAAATRGLVQRAYRSVLGAQEAEDLLDRVGGMRQEIWAPVDMLLENEVDLAPNRLIPQSEVISPVFVGRVRSDLKKNTGQSWFEWLPRSWAAWRLADILLDGDRDKNFRTEDLDAILAIGRTFGVETRLFTANTSRQNLLDGLSTSDDVWLVVEKLWKYSTKMLGENLRVVGGVPLWRELGDVWRQYNFYDEVEPVRWVQIAPFSEAQRQLFVLFPEVFAEAFGVGESSEFCTDFRCFSVLPGKRTRALPSDRAFLRDFDSSHWAFKYVVDLVDANILVPELNGKLHLDRAISRGEFAKMLVLDRYGEGFERATEVREFSDLKRGDEGYDAVQVLVQKNVIKGYPDGSFRPMQDLTRAEAVKILLAEEGFSPFEIHPEEVPVFGDAVGWERGWVEEAVRRGVVRGYADGTFGPSRSLTRAEAAKVIVESR